MRRFFFLQNSPVDCFVKPKELTELGTGQSQFVRAGVQGMHTPVQVKGGSIAQLSGVSSLSTRYITWHRKPQGISFGDLPSCRIKGYTSSIL